jgi:hypothetical protein
LKLSLGLPDLRLKRGPLTGSYSQPETSPPSAHS